MIDCAKEACPYVTSSDVSYDVFFFFFFTLSYNIAPLCFSGKSPGLYTSNLSPGLAQLHNGIWVSLWTKGSFMKAVQKNSIERCCKLRHCSTFLSVCLGRGFF